MTPEERAKAVVVKIALHQVTDDGSATFTHPIAPDAAEVIATAIREAEDAALERAARELHMIFLMNLENADAGLIEQAADRLSALKHTKD